MSKLKTYPPAIKHGNGQSPFPWFSRLNLPPFRWLPSWPRLKTLYPIGLSSHGFSHSIQKNAIQSHWFPSMKSHWKFHIMKIHENQWKSMNITEHQPFSIIFSYRDQLFFQVRKLYASGLKVKFFPSDQVPWQSSGTSLGVPKGSRVSVDAMCLFFIAWLMDEFKKDLSNLFQSYFYFF